MKGIPSKDDRRKIDVRLTNTVRESCDPAPQNHSTSASICAAYTALYVPITSTLTMERYRPYWALTVESLYFWKSVKWVPGLNVLNGDEPGFWERNGYYMYGDPFQEQRYWGS